VLKLEFWLLPDYGHSVQPHLRPPVSSAGNNHIGRGWLQSGGHRWYHIAAPVLQGILWPHMGTLDTAVMDTQQPAHCTWAK